MKKVIVMSAFFSFSLFAAEGLDMLNVADDTLLEKSRGMSSQVHLSDTDQSIENEQGGAIGDSTLSHFITGNNRVAAGAFSNSHGILMISLVSGNSNITNMSANVNIVSAK